MPIYIIDGRPMICHRGQIPTPRDDKQQAASQPIQASAIAGIVLAGHLAKGPCGVRGVFGEA